MILSICFTSHRTCKASWFPSSRVIRMQLQLVWPPKISGLNITFRTKKLNFSEFVNSFELSIVFPGPSGYFASDWTSEWNLRGTFRGFRVEDSSPLEELFWRIFWNPSFRDFFWFIFFSRIGVLAVSPARQSLVLFHPGLVGFKWLVKLLLVPWHELKSNTDAAHS